jgi:hypothetical protein
MTVPAGTAEATAVTTKAVVAICVEFVPDDAVGAVGEPVKFGDTKAFDRLVCTNAVVAIVVELSEAKGVGAVGFPVKVGEFSS